MKNQVGALQLQNIEKCPKCHMLKQMCICDSARRNLLRAVDQFLDAHANLLLQRPILSDDLSHPFAVFNAAAEDLKKWKALQERAEHETSLAQA